MKQLADDVYQLGGFPPDAINIYLLGDVLIDAGTRHDARRISRELAGRTISAHALTHAHPDHQGSSRAVIDRYGVPLYCGARDADAIESGDLRPCMPDSTMSKVARSLMAGPACPVARRLVEGDEVAGFTVLDVPGHSPGQVAYWRERDRTLILGDVLTGMNIFTTLKGLHEPPSFFTPDPALNRQSARKLAPLEPALVCFGHGPPWRDTKGFVEFASGLTH